MKDLKEFDISFVGLKEGKHHFEYHIEKTFFDYFKFDEYSGASVKVYLVFFKKTTMFELTFAFDGWVEVACDITNEMFHQPVKDTIDLVVKFGEEFNNENEELLILPHTDFRLNVAQYIYEGVILGVPLKRIHPGLENGSLKSPVLDKLKEFEIDHRESDSEKENDPRWDKLKNILIDKNTSNGTS